MSERRWGACCGGHGGADHPVHHGGPRAGAIRAGGRCRAGSRAGTRPGGVYLYGRAGRLPRGLYFSDIRANRIYYLDPNGRINSVREQTNGANGLALTRDGKLLAAEGDGKRISKRNQDGTILAVTEGMDGKPLMAPNDLIVDAKGAIYFTDPGPRPLGPGRTAYVYYVPAGAKQPTVIDDQITN